MRAFESSWFGDPGFRVSGFIIGVRGLGFSWGFRVFRILGSKVQDLGFSRVYSSLRFRVYHKGSGFRIYRASERWGSGRSW